MRPSSSDSLKKFGGNVGDFAGDLDCDNDVLDDWADGIDGRELCVCEEEAREACSPPETFR